MKTRDILLEVIKMASESIKKEHELEKQLLEDNAETYKVTLRRYIDEQTIKTNTLLDVVEQIKFMERWED